MDSNDRDRTFDRLLSTLRRATRRAKENKTDVARVVLVVVFVALALLAVHLERAYKPGSAWLITDTGWGSYLADLLISIGPELAGIGIGVVTIDYLNERRQDEQLKEQLILQMASHHNDVADTAIRTLRAHGWLCDGTLKGAVLSRANLNRADLRGVVLHGADLSGAKLNGAILRGANLREANLKAAELAHTDFCGADLTNASLEESDPDPGFMWEPDMDSFPSFIRATTELLSQAASREGTTMPGGTRLKSYDNPDGPTFEE